MKQQEVITELSVMKIYLNSHKQRLGVTSLSARLLSLGTLPPSRGHPSRLGPHSTPVQTFFYSAHIPHLFTTYCSENMLRYHVKITKTYFSCTNAVDDSSHREVSAYLNVYIKTISTTYYLKQCRPQFL